MTAITRHIIRGLDDGKAYTVRVAARDAEANDIYSPPAPPVTAWWEPMQVWFIDDTPLVNFSLKRLFFKSQTNKAFADVTCIINGAEINCPATNLASLDIDPGGVYNLSARASTGDEMVNTGLVNVVVDTNGLQGPSYTRARASGGNGRLAVAWVEPLSSGHGQH